MWRASPRRSRSRVSDADDALAAALLTLDDALAQRASSTLDDAWERSALSHTAAVMRHAPTWVSPGMARGMLALYHG